MLGGPYSSLEDSVKRKTSPALETAPRISCQVRIGWSARPFHSSLLLPYFLPLTAFLSREIFLARVKTQVGICRDHSCQSLIRTNPLRSKRPDPSPENPAPRRDC